MSARPRYWLTLKVDEPRKSTYVHRLEKHAAEMRRRNQANIKRREARIRSWETRRARTRFDLYTEQSE